MCSEARILRHTGDVQAAHRRNRGRRSGGQGGHLGIGGLLQVERHVAGLLRVVGCAAEPAVPAVRSTSGLLLLLARRRADGGQRLPSASQPHRANGQGSRVHRNDQNPSPVSRTLISNKWIPPLPSPSPPALHDSRAFPFATALPSPSRQLYSPSCQPCFLLHDIATPSPL